MNLSSRARAHNQFIPLYSYRGTDAIPPQILEDASPDANPLPVNFLKYPEARPEQWVFWNINTPCQLASKTTKTALESAIKNNSSNRLNQSGLIK